MPSALHPSLNNAPELVKSPPLPPPPKVAAIPKCNAPNDLPGTRPALRYSSMAPSDTEGWLQLELRTGAGLLKTRRLRFLRLSGSTLSCTKSSDPSIAASSESVISSATSQSSATESIPNVSSSFANSIHHNSMATTASPKDGIWKMSVRNASVAIGARPNEVIVCVDSKPVSLFAADQHDLYTWLFALRRASLRSTRIEDYYQIGSTIGEGMNGQVRQAYDFATGEKVAVKVVPRLGRDNEDDFLAREVKIVLSLDHENIVRTLDVFVRKRRVYFVMQYVSGGELFDYISENSNFSERQAASVIRDLLCALAYLHDKGIAHRDVKLENLLCAGTEWPFTIKLADFGFSSFVPASNAEAPSGKRDEALTSFVGTPYYIAPEMLSSSGHGRPVDLWATGVTLYILLSGKFPFGGTSEKEYYARVLHKPAYFPASEWSGVSSSAKSLIRGLLDKDPTARLTAKEALGHEWFKQALDVQSNSSESGFLVEGRMSSERNPHNIDRSVRRQQGFSHALPILGRRRGMRPVSQRAFTPLSNSAAADPFAGHSSLATSSIRHNRAENCIVDSAPDENFPHEETSTCPAFRLPVPSLRPDSADGCELYTSDQSFSFPASRHPDVCSRQIHTGKDEALCNSKNTSLNINKLAGQLSSCSSPEVGVSKSRSNSSSVLRFSPSRRLLRAFGARGKLATKPQNCDLPTSSAATGLNHPANSSSSSPDLSYSRYGRHVSSSSSPPTCHRSSTADTNVASEAAHRASYVADRPERQSIKDAANSYLYSATASPKVSAISTATSLQPSVAGLSDTCHAPLRGPSATFEHDRKVEKSSTLPCHFRDADMCKNDRSLTLAVSNNTMSVDKCIGDTDSITHHPLKSSQRVRRRPSSSMVRQLLSTGRLSLDSRMSPSERLRERDGIYSTDQYESYPNETGASTQFRGACSNRKSTEVSGSTRLADCRITGADHAVSNSGQHLEAEVEGKVAAGGVLSRFHFRSFHRPGSIDEPSRTGDTGFASDPDRLPPKLARAHNRPLESERRPSKRKSTWSLFAKIKRGGKSITSIGTRPKAAENTVPDVLPGAKHEDAKESKSSFVVSMNAPCSTAIADAEEALPMETAYRSAAFLSQDSLTSSLRINNEVYSTGSASPTSKAVRYTGKLPFDEHSSKCSNMYSSVDFPFEKLATSNREGVPQDKHFCGPRDNAISCISPCGPPALCSVSIVRPEAS